MAKSRKSGDSEEQQATAVDLIALLTPPGCDGLYEGEVVMPDADFDFDQLAAAAPEPEPAEAKKPVGPATGKPVSPTAKPGQPTTPAKMRPPPTSAEEYETLARASAPSSFRASASPAAPAGEKPGSARLQPLAEIPGDTLAKVAAEISECTRCDLCKTRNKTVPGVGNPKARLVFIGEAPGADEDASGIPFVGRAGQHLDKILAAAGFKREDIYICNILKCRPPGNRNPTLSEMLVCTPFLQRQLRLIEPKLIGCLGNVAIKFVIGPDSPGITRIHGQWFTSIFGVPAMAMYHPSYLIRDTSREKGSPNWQMWQDIQALKKRYDEFSG